MMAHAKETEIRQKYLKIDGLAGMGMKETTYARKGRMVSKDSMTVASTLNWVIIDETVGGLTHNISQDDSTLNNDTISVDEASDRYTAEINESMPTLLMDKNDMYYHGEGINTKREYKNDGDIISTNYYATLLTTSMAYGGVFSNALVFVDIVPGKVTSFIGQNFSSAFRLNSVSDKYSGLGFASDGQLIEETYTGKYTMNTKIQKTHKFVVARNNPDWVGCCPSDYDAAFYIDNSYHDFVSSEEVFDAEKQKGSTFTPGGVS
jgi:hypothetical protein